MNKAWENFDRLADACVRKEIGFAAFVRAADADFGRLARIVTRERRLPTWIDVEDVKSQLVALAWHYLFERRCKNGHVGFHPSLYRSAGAYARWKIRRKIAKVISRAKGENQHTRLGAGSPEYLSKTGELPDACGSSNEVEVGAECSIELKKLEKICETAREFAVLHALARGLGEHREVVAFLTKGSEPAFASAKEARVAIESFEAKAVAARTRRRQVAA